MNEDKMKTIEENEYEMIKRLQSALPDTETVRFNFDKIDLATYLYDTGCRKIADDENVIKKSEYEALLLEQKRLKEIVGRIPCGYVQKEEADYWKSRCKEIGDVASKETAREILQEVVNAWNTGNLNQRELAYICTKYGIELED